MKFVSKFPCEQRPAHERTSQLVSRIRGKDTTPEKVVRSLLHKMGYRFRLHIRIPIPPGKVGTSSTSSYNFQKEKTGTRWNVSQPKKLRFVRPDIVLPKYKTAIFVHGWWSSQDLRIVSRKEKGALAHCKLASAQRSAIYVSISQMKRSLDN